MATPVSASSSPIKETPQNEDPKEHPRMKAVHIILMIVILAMSLAAYSSVFGLHFTQTKIDKNGQNVFEQHKTKTIDSVDKSIRAVQTFPDLVKQEKFDGLSTELLKLVYKELKIDDLKDKELPGMSENRYEHLEKILIQLKTCPKAKNLITDKSKFMDLLNGPANIYKIEIAKILKPFIKAQTMLDGTIREESLKPGRLSKPNMEGYSGSMTTMLTEFKTSTVKRDDYYIKSFNNQIDLQNSSIFHQLLFIIIAILIGFVLYGIQVGTFVGFTKESISPKAYKLISNILIGICGFFVLIYLIFAVLGSIGMSPFAYQCELKAETQKTNSKFQNFHGESAKIQSITSECEKGQKVYQKMAANLNRDKIVGYLNGYESGVEKVAATLPNIDIVFDTDTIGNYYTLLNSQVNAFNLKSCLEDSTDQLLLETFVKDMKTAIDELNNLQKVPGNIANQIGTLMPKVNKLIDDSFVNFRNTTGKVVDSINSQLQSTDISCQIEKPPELCIEYEQNLLKINLINWIIFGGYVILLIHSILLHCFSRKMIREVDESNAAKEQLKKQLDDEKKKNKEQADEIKRKEEQAAKDKEEMQKKEDELEKVTEQRDSGQNRIVNLTDELRKQKAANNKAKLPSIENNFFGHPRARSV